MPFFSGYSFSNEECFFKPWLTQNERVVSGFSYGAQLAVKYALKQRSTILGVQLFSPAFFNDKQSTFKKQQLAAYERNKKAYQKVFIKKCLYPHDIDISEYIHESKKETLEELLSYRWKEEDLKKIVSKGIHIEVFLGEKDKIIDPKRALNFFKPYATCFYFKNKGHLFYTNFKKTQKHS